MSSRPLDPSVGLRVLGAGELLDLWDAGHAGTPMQRALLLLRTAYEGDQAIDHWTLGEVNARLLELRTLLFGRYLECLANCPACDAIVATTLDLVAMLSEAPFSPLASHLCEVELGATRVRFRIPIAADVAELPKAPHVSGHDLLDRIMDGSTLPDGDATTISAGLADEVARQLTRVDPLSLIELLVSCPACAHRWTAPLHAIDILWTELGALAQRFIGEVARLARAFGWREADILALSARRRQSYLEMLPA